MALSVDATTTKFQIDQCKAAIDRTGKGLGEMVSLMSSVNRKHGKIRDRGDDMAKVVIEYAQSDLPTMKEALDSFGRTVANVQEYREAYLNSTERSVIEDLAYYGHECKVARSDLNKLEKENAKYEKSLRNPKDQAKSTITTTRIREGTEKMKSQVIKFEEKRLRDCKKSLMEYARLEMTFAAKCLEQWSKCYQALDKISPEEDLLAFEKIISPTRLMEGLGFNGQRNEREQGLVSRLQNTSLSQPKSLTSQSEQFKSSFASNLKSTSNLSYGTPAQVTARSEHSTTPSLQSNRNQTTVTQLTPQIPSARASTGNVDEDDDEEESSEYETDSDEEEVPARTTRTSAWGQ